MEWQPIETAPNYHAGERLLVLVWNRYLGDGGVEMCLADGDFWRHRGEDCSYTHWMPVPSPPKLPARPRNRRRRHEKSRPGEGAARG